MGQRNVFPPEVANHIKRLIENSEDIEELLENGISVDDGGGSITIDTDNGPISITGSIDTDAGVGDTIFNQAVSVAPGATQTVVSYSPSSTEYVGGFTGNGDSDGRWILYINGNEKASAWTNQAEPNADTDLNSPIEIGAGDTVDLEIENVGLDSADYYGTIFIRL